LSERDDGLGAWPISSGYHGSGSFPHFRRRNGYAVRGSAVQLVNNAPYWLLQGLATLDPPAIAALDADGALGTLEQITQLEGWLSA
jgi:hypothetical protein